MVRTKNESKGSNNFARNGKFLLIFFLLGYQHGIIYPNAKYEITTFLKVAQVSFSQ